MRSGVPDDSSKPRGALRTLLGWSGQAALVLAAYFAITAWQERGLLEAESTAPPFVLKTLAGEPANLEAFRGKRVLLHFWATWCGVCRQEFDALNAVSGSLDNDEILLSIVSDAEDPAALARFVRAEGLSYPVLLGTETTLRDYNVHAFPTNYFLDATGRVRDHTVGLSTRWGLSARLGWARR